MAESVDALVSNTSGATRAGSTPALGTLVSKRGESSDSPFLFPRTCVGFLKDKVSLSAIAIKDKTGVRQFVFNG